MPVERVYRKKLCMTEFEIRAFSCDSSQYFDAGSGRPHASFFYIEAGQAAIVSDGQRLEVGDGALFYIPEGVRYQILWSGAPDIRFYVMEIVSRHYENRMSSDVYELQSIPALSTPETGERIREIYRHMATGERIEQIRALSLYYALYADVLPHLRTGSPSHQSPAMQKAIAYIEQNYAVDFVAQELAAACYLSESRLYHLFQSELGTTPVAYRNEIRVEKAAILLRESDLSCSEVGAKVGFGTASHFRDTFKSCTGLTPREYRKIGSGKLV